MTRTPDTPCAASTARPSCAACHKESLYRVKLSDDCYACHKADDKHKESLGT